MLLPRYSIVEGRRPAGLVLPPRAGQTAGVIGDYFVRTAALEAASAVAYGQLAYELGLYGAPDSLIDRCVRARNAEVRHARSLGRLAEAHGAKPLPPDARMVAARALVDVALENIVEGCVRQTYGAVAAKVRARATPDKDPHVRRVMEDIARDECVHAAVNFDVAMWLQAAIDPVEGTWVEDAMRHAVVALAYELDSSIPADLTTHIGLPTRSEALSIWSGLSKRVWHGISERVWTNAA